jgi:hypothetical protein
VVDRGSLYYYRETAVMSQLQTIANASSRGGL